MKCWQISVDGDYKWLRTSRPPFLTEYEKNLILWHRRERIFQAVMGVTLLSLVGFIGFLLSRSI